MLIPTFTEEFRLAEVERGRKSLFYFYTTILGMGFLDPETGESRLAEVHRDLCSFLEGRKPHYPWNFALVCAFRGMGKSVITTQAYPTWRGIYVPGFSTKIISNSYKNAQTNHFQKILNLWISSSRSDYLQWLYQHRLPTGFDGWNKEQIVFTSPNPQSAPSITFWGLDSKFEGWHGDLVILDDPEGADADKSEGASQVAWNAFQTTIPLLAKPSRGQILIVATPHGRTPIVYKIRDNNSYEIRDSENRVIGMKPWQGDSDNEHAHFKIFWRELLDEHGKSRWPAQFEDSYIQNHLRRQDIFSQQYMLRRSSVSASLFDMEAVVKSFYRFDIPSADQTTKLLRYPSYEFDPDKVSEEGFVVAEPKWTTVALGSLRFYIHFDPVHKEERARRTPTSTQRPSYPAIVVVGVAPDNHAFVVDYWFGKDGKADINKQIVELFRLYRIWCPYLITWESIGAQVWLKGFVEAIEKSNPLWMSPRSTGTLWKSMPLPRMSRRLQEGDKMTQSKEDIYRTLLSPWVNGGIVHFRKEQDDMIHQLSSAQNEYEPVDLLDALAQGPEVWKPPVSEEHERGLNRRRGFVRQILDSVGWQKRTGYTGPSWGEERRFDHRRTDL